MHGRIFRTLCYTIPLSGFVGEAEFSIYFSTSTSYSTSV